MPSVCVLTISLELGISEGLSRNDHLSHLFNFLKGGLCCPVYLDYYEKTRPSRNRIYSK
jgi:hypothetical protein